jgi:hypothetical protein
MLGREGFQAFSAPGIRKYHRATLTRHRYGRRKRQDVHDDHCSEWCIAKGLKTLMSALKTNFVLCLIGERHASPRRKWRAPWHCGATSVQYANLSPPLGVVEGVDLLNFTADARSHTRTVWIPPEAAGAEFAVSFRQCRFSEDGL